MGAQHSSTSFLCAAATVDASTPSFHAYWTLMITWDMSWRATEMFVTRVRSMRAWNACEGQTSNVMREKKFAERNLRASSQHSCWKLSELTTRSAEVAGRDVEIAPSPVDLK